MKDKMKYGLVVMMMSLPGSGMMYGAGTGNGVFSVSSTKTVKFANANSVYSENELIQWAHLEDFIDNGWDVLTADEWTYLLVTRDGEGTSKNNLGTVEGKYGLIILPDEWSQPEGTTYAATPMDYATNVYTAEQWALMANAGAVFLPCAGYGWIDKGEYKVEDPTDHGSYWAKNEVSLGSTNAYCMRFSVYNIHDFNNAIKTNYYSVILVRDATLTELDEEDDLSAFSTKLTAADDHDYAYVWRTLKKDGTYYTLCLPFDVPDIDDSPLEGAEVFTFTGGSVRGTTGNERLQLNLSRLVGKRLTQGVPYLLRWENTGETLAQPLYFENVENWDTDTETATDPGNASVKLHGVYPKAHITGYETAEEAHYNFFLGANNTLYWPDDATYGEDAKMKGFRAYFYIVPPDPGEAPRYRNMPVVWHIGASLEATTAIGEGLKVNGECRKVIIDGKIYLMYEGRMYDVQGRRVED